VGDNIERQRRKYPPELENKKYHKRKKVDVPCSGACG
jgi:hypothetical protein